MGNVTTGANNMRVAIAAALCMVVNFLWFDLSLQALPQTGLPRFDSGSGLTCFLCGMSCFGLLCALAPRTLERHGGVLHIACAAFGTVLACLLAFARFDSWDPLPLAPLMAGTGFANVCLLVSGTLLLASLMDRRLMSLAVAFVFALRSLVLFALNVAAPETLWHALLPLLPLACIALLVLGSRIAGGTTGARPALPRFKAPLSTAMFGLLAAASIVFAVTATATDFERWRPAGMSELSAGSFVIGTTAFLCIAYVTLVRTKSNLLFRFLPGLFVLLTSNVFLSLGLYEAICLPRGASLILRFYTEVYGEAFAWIILLYAVRTLAIAPYRVIGCFFFIEASTEIFLRSLNALDGSNGLAIVTLGILVTVGVLVWALYQLYEMQDRVPVNAPPCANCPHLPAARVEDPQAAAPAPNAANTSDVGRYGQTPPTDLAAIASVYGLSSRETSVFMLLAQGHSRRHICDELFIADGTVSTHINRIYAKLGIHSKQELIDLVTDGDPRRK